MLWRLRSQRVIIIIISVETDEHRQSRLDVRKFSFAVRVVQPWNSLREEVVTAPIVFRPLKPDLTKRGMTNHWSFIIKKTSYCNDLDTEDSIQWTPMMMMTSQLLTSMLKHNEQLKMAVNAGQKWKQRLFDMIIVFLGEAKTVTVRSQQQTFSNINYQVAVRRDPCIFCRQPNCLEFTAGSSAGSSCWLRTIYARLEDVSESVRRTLDALAHYRSDT